MGTFNEHIKQSQKNLLFLSNISLSIDNCWDWQVTVCFYSALHLINAHVAQVADINYLSHKDVDVAINPYNKLSLSKLSEDVYTSYISLFNLSRRSRYLLNENGKTGDPIQIACTTHSIHLKKAVYHLNVILNFVQETYKENFQKADIKCIDLNGNSFEHFNIVK